MREVHLQRVGHKLGAHVLGHDSIAMMCRVLEVARSGFHARATRPPSPRAVQDARLTERIREVHAANRGVYGAPPVHAELVQGDGERLGRKRVERLMRAAGLSGLQPRRRRGTTVRVPGVRVAEDLVDSAFMAAAPNRLWVADITYLRTWEGWLYLVAVQDVYSRRIVGWSMLGLIRLDEPVHRYRPFSPCLAKKAAALLKISRSSVSTRFSRRSRRSSSRSSVLKPGCSPASTSSWRSQLRSDCGETPSSTASCGIAGRYFAATGPPRS